MTDDELLTRITVHPDVYGGKPIIRGRRLAVEHILSMLAAGETVAGERVEPLIIETVV